MKEPSESSSGDSYHALAKSDLLYWKSNSTTNLLKWQPMFLSMYPQKYPKKGNFGVTFDGVGGR